MNFSDREMRTLLSIFQEVKIKVKINLMEILKEIRSCLEKEYENIKINIERCVTEKGIKYMNTNKNKILREDFDLTIEKDWKL